MTPQSNNLRVRRTQKLLREALIALIEERGFDTLTVGEIAQRAMVSRAAFYRNYQDKYDLVERIFEEALDTLLNALGNFGPERPPQQWINLFEHVAEYERLYRALLGRQGSPWFATKMRSSLSELVTRHASIPEKRPIVERRVFVDGFVPMLLASLFVDAITWWLEQDRPYTPREMAIYCSQLAASIYQEAGTWE
ncbi:TetR/AcrR family transcriptional regulator [Ktedonosporobacter rubrisoli]|uniref:TetR/AcrR family transcriptional regulator n=1 Tax=Ktedonosporobacter rubrisoli TaxID=2509675 RepID=A0A4P6JV80_KTERU|nr:TetR/AcrR family transcriptional regulator [Ktedonosporobacter rubrisoli]QBD79569.1 TetR/AcrR family transcriptional regulator [Ktedonosporobacter rubrisoli]